MRGSIRGHNSRGFVEAWGVANYRYFSANHAARDKSALRIADDRQVISQWRFRSAGWASITASRFVSAAGRPWMRGRFFEKNPRFPDGPRDNYAPADYRGRPRFPLERRKFSLLIGLAVGCDLPRSALCESQGLRIPAAFGGYFTAARIGKISDCGNGKGLFQRTPLRFFVLAGGGGRGVGSGHWTTGVGAFRGRSGRWVSVGRRAGAGTG